MGKWNKHLRFTTDEGEVVSMYNSERSDGQIRLCCPPDNVLGLLRQAWIAMRPGIHNPSRKATVKEVARFFRAMCISKEAAEWAARKADEYYDNKIGFEKFIKLFEVV